MNKRQDIRIGVIADTHGLFDPAILRHFKGVDHILHAGDIGRLSVIEQLRAIAPVTAVSGNVDDYERSGLPSETVIVLAGRRLAVRHIVYEGGKLTKEARAFLRREQPDICIFGHTHQPNRLLKNHFDTRKLRWSARVAQWRTLPQDAQKCGLLTRPTPARQDAPFLGQGRSSAVDPRFTFYASRFTVPWNDARTPLADFFSILLKYDRQPDDCVPEIAIATVNRKVAKPTDQLREWKLFGKDHARMRTADFLPVCRKRQEVLAVEGNQRSLLLRGKRELLVI